MNLQTNYPAMPNFKSGLTWKIIQDIKQTNVAKTQADFAKIGLDADFRGKKSVCANFVYAANILYDICEKYKLPFDFVPYSISVYKNKELIKPGSYFAFTINDTGKVLNGKPSFIGGSIFINDFGSGIYENDFYTNQDYKKGRRSSSHFLSNTLHEWFHAIHMDLMYKKYGYEGKCPILRDAYQKSEKDDGLQRYENMDKTNFSSLPDDFVKYIGEYAVKPNSMLEMFAELMTKITTLSLDKKLNVIKNPLDNLPNNLPKEVKNILEDLLDI